MFTTYTSNPTSNFKNNMYTYIPDAEEDDDVTIVINKKTLEQETGAWNKIIKGHPLPQYPHADTMFNTSHINIVIYQEIPDAGATGNFVPPETPVKKIKIYTNPLIINLPYGYQIKSTHTCQLDIPWLPAEAKEAHIVPGLAHKSLVYIKVLCDAGCNVEYDSKECRVIYKDKTVCNGTRETSTVLWVLTLNPTMNTKLSTDHVQ